MFFIDEYIFTIASIEILGSVLCLLSILGELFRKSGHHRMSRNMKVVLLLSALCLMSDGISCLISGNPSGNLVLINNICLNTDFIGFLLALYFLLVFFINYGFLINRKQSKRLTHMMLLITTLNTLLVIINLFVPVLYYLDSHNNFVRGPGIYFYAFSLLIESFSTIVVAIRERKNLSKSIYFEIIVCACSLSLGGILEVLLDDFPGSNLGLGISIILIFIVEQAKLNRNVYNKNQSFSISFINFFLFTTFFICLAFLINIVSLMKVAKSNSEHDCQGVAQMICESINSSIMEPVTVARTMSNSENLITELKFEKQKDDVYLNKKIVRYLASIKDGMKYQVAFAVSEKSHQYYTNSGVTKIIDPENDAHDIWYTNFISKHSAIDLDVDTDENHFNQLSLFVNSRIEDSSGNLLGVCGVAVPIKDLQDILSKYEEMYDIDISIIDPEGLVQISTNTDKIESEQLDSSYLEEAKQGGFNYEILDDHIRMTRYMEDINWYIVITDYHPDKIGILQITIPGILAAGFGLLLIVGAFLGIHMYQDRIGDILYTKMEHEKYLLRLSKIDELTGIKNRNAFEEFQKQIGSSPLSDEMQVVLMDINGLKTVNDKFGHAAGDELIIGAAQCIQNTLGTVSELYRIGGDEFVAVSYSNQDNIKEQLDLLYKTLTEWSGDLVKELSISIGSVSSSDEHDKTFSELVKIADHRMYADKNAYYRKTGKDRRMSW